VEVTPLLREFDFAQFRTGNLRLPLGAWQWVLRLAWMSGHGSQRAARDDFVQRVQAVAQMLDAETEPLLVVSHGGMMMHLAAELIRRGFAGPKLGVAEHAKLYLYERDEAALLPPQGGRLLEFICGVRLKTPGR
jgi:broad specificity phosphatase PhoE